MKKNLFLTLLMLLISSFVYAQEEEWKEWSGTFGAQGDNLRWTYYSRDRVLLISGVGAMEDFDIAGPWFSFRDDDGNIFSTVGLGIHVIIGEGVTTIGNNAFLGSLFSSLELPSSIVSIGNNLFFGSEYGVTIRTHWMKPLNLILPTLYYQEEYIRKQIQSYEIIVPYGTKDAYIAAGWTEEIFHGGVREQPLAQGTCGKDGDNLTWMVTEDGTLTISGQGEMKDYDYWEPQLGSIFRYPWKSYYGPYLGNYRWNIKKIIVEEGVTSIGTEAFCCFDEDNDYKESIDISLPNSLKSIGGRAFAGCESLKSIKIPNGVKSIEQGTFEGCSNLTNVQLSEGLTSIGLEAFSDCENLKSIKIPGSVTFIDRHAFEGTSLSSIVVDSKNTVYDSRDNCNAIIETATNSLFIGCKKTVIPNSVTSIGEEAFLDCTGLTSIEIPNSVTSIGDEAFSECI